MILFKPEHVGLILAQHKTQTRRTGDRRWNVGSTHQARTNMPWQGTEGYFADIRILDVRRERLGDISEEDVMAEGYDTLAEFREVWRGINGRWNPDERVWVVEFEVEGGGSS